MYSIYILAAMIFVAIILGLAEYYRHQKRIYSIPIRIHINGTRGKSSVTRLIGAGLREGGIATITKVTGTFPRLIIEDGSDTFIHRKAGANIIEQLAIVKYAYKRKAQALVMECMALQPQYQWITENKMIHSTINIITNVRMDHLDVMGRSIEEIAATLGKTIPRNGHFFSSEDVIPEVLKKIADKRNNTSHFITKEGITNEDMKGFSYIEHRINVALAVAICEHLGVDKQTALRGMYKAIPDAGVLKCFTVEAYKKQMSFYNAFAANDPDSTYILWKMLRDEIGFEGKSIVLINTRQDRLYRGQQLAELAGTKLNADMDYLVLMGQSTDVIQNIAVNNGVSPKKIVNLGWVTPDKIFETFLSLTDNTSTIIAIGNMGGMGAATAEYFEHRKFMNHD